MMIMMIVMMMMMIVIMRLDEILVEVRVTMWLLHAYLVTIGH